MKQRNFLTNFLASGLSKIRLSPIPVVGIIIILTYCGSTETNQNSGTRKSFSPFEVSSFVFENDDYTKHIEVVKNGNVIDNHRELLVTNNEELKTAISIAMPNDKIVLKNGNWRDLAINFRSSAKPLQPITLKSETPGEVVLSGSSKVILSAPYLVVDGLLFKNGTIEKGSVIRVESNHCSILNTAIIDYNPSKFETEYSWIRIKGSNNTIENCYFQGKDNLGPLIHNYGYRAKNNIISRCYFKDIPLVRNKNGREIIRVIGPGHDDKLNENGAFCIIESNLFENADGEGVEIISLKASRNIVQNNTVLSSCGGFVSRRGGYNVFRSNIFLGEMKSGTFGIRLSNEHHIIENNYIEDVVHSGVAAMCGEFIDSALTLDFDIPERKKMGQIIVEPMYAQTKNCRISNNLVVNAKYGLEVGRAYKKDWSTRQLVLLPESNQIENNLIINHRKDGIHISSPDQNTPLSHFVFEPNSIGYNQLRVEQSSTSFLHDFNKRKNKKLSAGADVSSLQLLSSKNVGPSWMRARN